MYRTITTLIAAAFAATTLTLTSAAVASPAPNDGGPASTVSVHGRTDQQFWGEATWENPLSGLNLDRTPGVD
jgi:hypothetical protein